MKKLLKHFVNKSIALLRSNKFFRRIHGYLLLSAFESTLEINHGSIRLKFCIPNEWARSRAKTFSVKEPETIEWIDTFDSETVLWDVGANIGLYSIYTALRHSNAKVYAFEPSVFNLELLARNIVLNGLENRVTIVPIALNETSGTDILRMSMTHWGGAMSTFGQTFTHDGTILKEVFSYRIPACSMDDAAAFFDLPKPSALKIDVDGIEHLILKGGSKILHDNTLKTIIIEVNDDFSEQSEVVKSFLESADWNLKAKRHGDWVKQTDLDSVFNQIWERK
jgi:FkbM family methyltransferase